MKHEVNSTELFVNSASCRETIYLIYLTELSTPTVPISTMAGLLLVALLSAVVSVASAEDFPQAPVFQIPEVSNLIASSKLPTVFMQ